MLGALGILLPEILEKYAGIEFGVSWKLDTSIASPLTDISHASCFVPCSNCMPQLRLSAGTLLIMWQ